MKRKILNILARENIHITKPDMKKNPDALGVRIHFSAEKAILAQDALIAFINKVSKDSLDYNLKEFIISYKEKLSDLHFEISKIEQSLNIQRKVKLENLNSALDIAKQANIKDYSESFRETNNNLSSVIRTDTFIPLSESQLYDNPYLFILGQRYINAQIKSIEQNKLIYPPKYYQIQNQLMQLDELDERIKTVTAEAYSYISSPDYPVVKDKPKRLLIIILGFLVGLVLSIIAVMIKNTLFVNKELI